MKRQSFLERSFLTLVTLAFVAYMGYQVYQKMEKNEQTVEAVSVTAVDKISAEGVFLRQQVAVDWSAREMTEFLVDEGEKVSAGQDVAVIFSDDGSKSSYAKYVELSKKLETLKAGEAYVSDDTGGAKFSSLIESAVEEYAKAYSQSDVSKITDSSYQLKSLIELQNSGISTKESYDSEVAQLESELKSIDSANLGGRKVKSPTGGYFFSSNDGFDEIFLPSSMEYLTSQDIENAVSQKDSFYDESAGKIVTEFEWYFAVVLSDADAKKVDLTKSFEIVFPQVSSGSEPATLVSLKSEGNDKNVAIFKSTHMTNVSMDTRCQQSEIILGEYTGIKIPKTAIRQEAGKWGVYCLVGEQAVFKEVEWLYETDSYYIVKKADSAADGLYDYDKIIISSELLEKSKN